jgi:hypothetical protein
MAPLFVVFLAAQPGPPLAPKALLGLLLVMSLSLTVGVLLIPLLRYYPASAILIVAAGLYASMYLTLIRGKRLLGTFLTVGFTLISVAGSVDYALATTVIESLALGISLAVLCQWLVYPLLPEPAGTPPAAEAPQTPVVSNWLALRAALVVLPAYLLALTNPAQYLMTIMKSVSLGHRPRCWMRAAPARTAGVDLRRRAAGGSVLVPAQAVTDAVDVLPVDRGLRPVRGDEAVPPGADPAPAVLLGQRAGDPVHPARACRRGQRQRARRARRVPGALHDLHWRDPLCLGCDRPARTLA